MDPDAADAWHGEMHGGVFDPATHPSAIEQAQA
jgi:hypothetical protein